MLLSIRNTAIAAVAALATVAAPLSSAQAWGKNEQNFLKGALATGVVGAIILQSQNQNRLARQVYSQPGYAQRSYPRPVYDQPVYNHPAYRHPAYNQPLYREPAYVPVYVPQQPSVYGTPAARAFESYSGAERLKIQRRLAAYGYYRGSIDGSFGPATYDAVTAYAQDYTRTDRIASIDQAFGVYDALIY